MRWPWTKDHAEERQRIENDLLSWAGIVGEIERGYEGGIHDYTNDLELGADLRARVAKLTAKDPLHAQLGELDARYETATRAVGVEAIRGTDEIRAPVNLSGELAADLRARGWT